MDLRLDLKKIKTNKHKRSIIQYNLDMEIIAEFDSIMDASIKLNINNSCILDCCKGRQKTSGGFIFRYK